MQTVNSSLVRYQSQAYFDDGACVCIYSSVFFTTSCSAIKSFSLRPLAFFSMPCAMTQKQSRWTSSSCVCSKSYLQKPHTHTHTTCRASHSWVQHRPAKTVTNIGKHPMFFYQILWPTAMLLLLMAIYRLVLQNHSNVFHSIPIHLFCIHHVFIYIELHCNCENYNVTQ